MALGVPTSTMLNGGNLRSPSTPAPKSSSPSSARSSGRVPKQADAQSAMSGFTPTPEFGGMPQRPRDLSYDQIVGLSKAGVPESQWNDYLKSQINDPRAWAGLGPEAQRIAAQWGTNLPYAGNIVDQQRANYLGQQQQQQATNQYVDQFGALQDLNALNLQNQFNQGSAMAQARFDMGRGHLEDNLYNDLGILGQQKFRSVDLARDDNRAALLHNSNMRGVLDTSRGLVGQDFSRQQGFLNDQLGFLNDRQDLAYRQFGSTDAYAGQQARDLMAQYGFAGRQFDQTQQEAFANRNTQQRAATSDATARGAFSSAGFGDNLQDIYGQYERSMDANTLQLDRTTQSIDERNRDIGQQRKDLRLGYEGQQIGFRQDARGINNQHDINRISTAGQYNQLTGQYSANDLQRANLQNVDKGLASLAKEYGLREQDLKNGFNQAIDKMGLDLNETQQQLGQMLNSGNANLQAQAMQFMTQMMAYQ